MWVFFIWRRGRVLREPSLVRLPPIDQVTCYMPDWDVRFRQEKMMCTPGIVNEAQKKKIAAYGATFRKATTSPFGSKDEIGMLNLIDRASREAVVGRADASKMFDLAVDYFVGMPSWDQAGDPG